MEFNRAAFDKRFDRAVLWGHKLHSHTHSYIHNAFFRAFTYLGVNALWLDDRDDISKLDLSRSLFITEGQVDDNIPIRDDSHYVTHNCRSDKYKPLYGNNKCISIQVYTDDALKRNLDKRDTCTFFDVPGKCAYITWATDLLPDEIEANKPQIAFNQNSKNVFWIGTIGGQRFGNIDQITPFMQAAAQNHINFVKRGGVSVEENIKLVKDSYMAPTIVGAWQLEVGYVPCRIFKNISYGQFGLTNSPRVAELFEGKIVCNTDTNRLFYDSRDYLSGLPLSELHALMDVVKEKHTYVNRINTLLEFIEMTS